MPTYQYVCTHCGEPLEAVQKFTDDPLTQCPACGGRLRKVFNSVGIVFKGSGFYRTDSRNGSVAGSPSKPSTDAASAPSTSASTATESSSSNGGSSGAPSGKSSGGGSGGSGASASSGSSSSSGSTSGSAPAKAATP